MSTSDEKTLDLSSRLGTLSPEKQALLARKLAERSAARAPIAEERIPQRADGPAPLSHAQELLWLHEQMNPGTATYNVPMVRRVRGPLDLDALQQAIDAMIVRHESLRTKFVQIDGAPRQTVLAPRSVPITKRDLRMLPPEEREADAEVLITRAASQPFDLAVGAMPRVTVVRLDEEDAILLIVAHHIVFDGSSTGIFLRELAAAYDAVRTGAPIDFPALPIQLADFAAWERQQGESTRSAAALDFWRDYLDGAPASIELPTDSPRGGAPTGPGAREQATLPIAVRDAVRTLASAHQATSFMVLLAAVQTLLHRYSGQDDLVVGAPVAGRSRRETEGLVGYLANTLALRARFADDPSMGELLRHTRESVARAFEHQELPYETLVGELRAGRPTTERALFTVLVAQQDTSGAVARLGEATLESSGVDVGAAKAELSLSFAEAPNGLRLAIEYRSDLYRAETIQRMFGHLETLLVAAAAAPDAPLSRLPIVTEVERRQLLVEWNDTDAAWPTDATLHGLFEAQVRARPDAIAVECDRVRLTYGELETRANRLAWRLRAAGVGPDALVAVCMEKSVDVVAVLLGILKAGGAYVPIDPTYPDERIAFTLEDSAARIVVTEPSLVARLATYAPTIVLAEEGWGGGPDARDDAPPPSAAPTNLCYVIYTSGSTGRPKGVLIEHRNVVRLLCNDRFQFDFSERDVWTVFHSFAFDFSVWEMYGALLYGGRVIVIPKETAQDPAAYLDLLARERVTVLNQVPSAFYGLMQEALGRPTVPDLALRYVIFGGEALQPALLREWKARYPSATLVNMFGITETTVHVTFKEIGEAEMANGASNIGGPIPTLTTYVLDAHLDLVPVGVTGELCVGGAGVARGYLNRPDLTAERFVAHPFRAGDRLYRSGDLGRLHTNGQIEYLGRRDSQVKLRGFRIELGEVEAAIAALPGVRAVAVIVRPDGAGDPRLLGYVVAEPASDLTPQGIRTALGRTLPEHMVPAVVTMLDALPTTPNGKTDAKALPEPEMTASSHEYDAPRTKTELAVAATFAEVLRVERVGAHDSFFELGGHSLLAIRIAARLQSLTGTPVPLRRIFEHPTVRALAEAISGGGEPDLVTPSVDVAASPRDAFRRDGAGDVVVMPASFAQARLWLIEELAPGQSTYNVPLAWRLRGTLDVNALQSSVNALCARHDVLRTTFDVQDGASVQVIHPFAPAAIAIRDLSAEPDAEQRAFDAVRADANVPFDLRNGRVVRFSLFRVAADDHLLLVTLHHIAADGWSTTILRRELGEGYAAAREHRAPSLPPLPIQYADYAVHQREELRGARLTELESYWRKRLRGPLPVLELPMRAGRPASLGVRPAKRHVFQVPAATAAALDGLARAEQTTPFMVYLAAFKVLLARYAGQDDVLVGTPMAGRAGSELEGLMGLFLNMLALRTDLSGNPTFRALLGRVRDVTLGAFAHDALPFERVIDVAKPPRDESITPIFQVLFTMQNAASVSDDASAAIEPRFPGLATERVSIGVESTKFDMQLTLAPAGDGYRAQLEYDASLFDDDTIERLTTHFVTMLGGIARDAATPIGALPMLSDDERTIVTTRWNPASTPLPAWTVPERVLDLARTTPDAVAVRADDGVLSYGDLAHRSAIVARALAEAGVGRGDRVAVCVDRTTSLLAALLGVLRAGAVYVPIDAGYPSERIAYVLGDSGSRAVLTDAASRGSLPPTELPLLVLDEATWGAPLGTDDVFASAPIDGESLAYVLYTSGSTGKPKGVMIPHRALANFLASMAEQPGLAAGDAIVAVTTISFDIAGLELWMPLVTGAEIVLASRLVASDGEALRSLVESTAAARPSSRVLLQATPVTWRMLLAAGWAGTSNLVMLCGGEAWPPGLAESLVTRGAAVWNVYGPTETTIWSSRARVTDADLSLGEPLANTTLHVLEPSREPAPLGVPGELWIGGAGLATGYHARPELTTDRFVDIPSLGRLYRTGDRVRRTADGRLRYLGRLDDQVKVRGFRVELGEIESVLTAQPEVQSSVVLVREDVPGDQRLVAYCVAEDESTSRPAFAAAASIVQRDRLKALLPSYMVPSAFVWLDVWPLTPNGKLDRKALPAPASDEVAGPAAAHKPPETAVEEIIAGVWMEILRLPRVGIDDDFFDLGGHSLLAMQVVSRVSGLFRRQIMLRSFFQHSTIRGFGTSLAQSETTPGRTEAVARALVRLRDMSPEERERRSGAAAAAADTGTPSS